MNPKIRAGQWTIIVMLGFALLSGLTGNLALASESPAQFQSDPSGAKMGSAVDESAPATVGDPLAIKLTNSVGRAHVSINLMWALIAGFLVMFMQAGFAMVNAGFTRAKNVAHTMAMNLMIYPIAMLGFYICGFALMFGGMGPIATLGGYAGLNHEVTFHFFGKPFGIFGGTGFFLSGTSYDVAVFTLFLFQVVFMNTAATIPIGACAERWKFSAFCLYGCFVGSMIYPIFGNWVWGHGWLSQLGANFGLGHGYVDFAGSSVVHMCGGVTALVGAWVLGPRFGKFNKEGSINAIPPHNIPMAIIGTFILAFGWFGFNSGATLVGADLRVGVIAVNTMLASATGAVSSILWMWFVRSGKPDPSMGCNGMLAGLVAIAAPCAFVNSISACIIGIVAGLLVVEAVFFFDRVAKIDDPVGAISVHGVCGAWGCLSTGLFADGTYGEGWNGVAGTVQGLFFGGGIAQLVAETIGVATCFITVGCLSLAVFKLIDWAIGHRSDIAAEVDGLDVPEMGIDGYSGVVLDRDAETPRSK